MTNETFTPAQILGGLVITRGELWREMCTTRNARPLERMRVGGLILGVNASVNMFY